MWPIIAGAQAQPTLTVSDNRVTSAVEGLGYSVCGDCVSAPQGSAFSSSVSFPWSYGYSGLASATQVSTTPDPAIFPLLFSNPPCKCTLTFAGQGTASYSYSNVSQAGQVYGASAEFITLSVSTPALLTVHGALSDSNYSGGDLMADFELDILSGSANARDWASFDDQQPNSASVDSSGLTGTGITNPQASLNYILYPGATFRLDAEAIANAQPVPGGSGSGSASYAFTASLTPVPASGPDITCPGAPQCPYSFDFEFLPGGTLQDPASLEGFIGPQTSEVFNSIGGNGSQAFYRFNWGGGLFSAIGDVYGADPQAQYHFDLLNSAGDLVDSILLNSADNFDSEMYFLNLDYGDYEIGLVTDSTSDPDFSITFNSPIGRAGSASVPEPASLGLLCLGLLGVAAVQRQRRSKVSPVQPSP